MMIDIFVKIKLMTPLLLEKFDFKIIHSHKNL